MATVCVCTMHVCNLMLLVFNVKSTDTSQTYNMTIYISSTISYHTSHGMIIINHLSHESEIYLFQHGINTIIVNRKFSYFNMV